MFELKLLNVHRIVATEAERDQLLNDGFELVGDTEPDFASMKVGELRAYAEGIGVELGEAATKDDIIAKLKGGQ